jgi:hypothetical protein
MILADNETRVDLLNNEAVASTIIKLLRGQRGQPVTVGVHGDWGTGNFSILEMITIPRRLTPLFRDDHGLRSKVA